MAEVQKSAFVPAAIHAQNGRIPDLFVTSGEVGVRGYAARFFNVTGELIKPSATQNLTCYALNLTTEKAYYTEGTYTDDTWYIEVPRQAVESDGRVAIQLALKEGDTALLITDTSVVDVHNFLGGDSSRPLDADNGILMDYQKLHAQAEAAAAALDAVTATANRADALQKQAREDITKIEAKEASRNSAESARVSAESARASAESARKAQEEARVRAESARTGAESARVEAEKKRVTAENARASAENSRASQESTRQSNENMRKTQESARQSAESSRVSAEEKRKQTFDGWDKTMQGIIPQADATSAGVVKAKGTAQESAPYTVPSMGILNEEIQKAGKVKSVNGMTGDVTVPQYTLPQATETELGGVKIRKSYGPVSGGIEDTTDVVTVQYAAERDNAFSSLLWNAFVTKSYFDSKVVPATESNAGLVKIHEEQASEFYNTYKNMAAGVSYVKDELDGLGGMIQVGLDSKQDKIKQVTSIPTVDTTTSDPDGTIYAVIPDDGQQGGAVGALTMEDVVSMGLLVTSGPYPSSYKGYDRYLIMKDFSLKYVKSDGVMEAGFYLSSRYNAQNRYPYTNDICNFELQYHDGNDFTGQATYGSKPFLEHFKAGDFTLEYRDFGPLEGVIFSGYREQTSTSALINSSSRYNVLFGKYKTAFSDVNEKTLFPGCFVCYCPSTINFNEFSTTFSSVRFIEKVDRTAQNNSTVYGYRIVDFSSTLADYKKTPRYIFSAYHPKSPIYIKSGTGVEPPQSLYIKRNGKIVKL